MIPLPLLLMINLTSPLLVVASRSRIRVRSSLHWEI
jgi:hypothetical protein